MRLTKKSPRPFLFLFLLFSMSVIQDAVAQNGDVIIVVLSQPPPTSMLVYIGGGSITPTSTGKDQAYLTNSIGINASVYKPLLIKEKFTLGINAGGEYAFSNKDPLTTLPNPFHVIGETSSTITSSGKMKQQSLNFGVGPQANFYLGKRCILSPIFLVGYISIDLKDYNLEPGYSYNGSTYKYKLLNQTETKTSGLALIPKLRFQYFFNHKIGLWAEANYTMGPAIKNTVSTFTPEGNPNNGQYSFQQMQAGTNKTETRATKYNVVGVELGIVIEIVKLKVVTK